MLVLGIGVLIVWFSAGDDNYQPITEEPHPHIDSLINKMNQALGSRNYHQGDSLASGIIRQSGQQNYRYGEVWATGAKGFIYRHAAKYDSSILMFERSRDLVKKYKLDLDIYHKFGSHLADSYHAVGEAEKGLKVLDEALTYFKKTNNLSEISAVYNNMGLLYQYQSRFTKAQEVFEKGLTYAKKVPEDRYYERSFIGNLGILFKDLGQYDKAVPLIERSLQMGREMNDRTAQAIDLNNLGSINFIRGNFRKAIGQYLEAARLSEEIGENSALLAALKNLGKIYDVLNDDENAAHYYRKCEQIIETQLERKYELFPFILQRIGEHWIRRESYSKATDYLNKAIEGYKHLEKPLELAMCYTSLSKLELNSKNYDKSIQLARQAMKEFEDIGVRDVYRAEPCLLLGIAHFEIGQKSTAISFINQAIAFSERTNESEIAWQAHFYLARYFREIGNLSAAIGHCQKAIGSLEDLRQYTISPQLGSRFLEDKVQIFHQYFDILFERYDNDREQATLEKLFVLSEQTRSRALLDNIKAGMKNVFYQIKESAALQNVEEQLVALNRLIREEQRKPLKDQRRDLLNSWREQAGTLRQKYELLSNQFAAANPKLSALLSVNEEIALSDIQKCADEHATLLSYYVSLEDVYAFVISNSDIRLVKLNVSPKELRKNIARLRQPFQELKAGKTDFYHLKFDTQLSRSLYNALLAPLKLKSDFPAQRGRSPAKLIIVPDGFLSYLPFELLVTARKSREPSQILFDEYSQFRYLIEDYTISYLPATTIAPLISDQRHPGHADLLLAFGNPTASKGTASMEPVAEEYTSSRLRSLAMTPLPGATREVEGIANLFGSEEVLALIGENASEALYKKSAGQFRYIHFATHGYVDEVNPNFSSLLLNPGSSEEDGFLYSYEVYGTPLTAEMVTLSACETGLGKLRKSEGLISFLQSFFSAGSQRVMVSLWSVEESTYPLMIAFYKNIHQGMNKSEALRQAKLAFMRDSSMRGEHTRYAHTHPFLWAPFVLYGVE